MYEDWAFQTDGSNDATTSTSVNSNNETPRPRDQSLMAQRPHARARSRSILAEVAEQQPISIDKSAIPEESQIIEPPHAEVRLRAWSFSFIKHSPYGRLILEKDEKPSSHEKYLDILYPWTKSEQEQITSQYTEETEVIFQEAQDIVDSELAYYDLQLYDNHRQVLSRCLSSCESMDNQVDVVLSVLDKLAGAFDDIETQAAAFQDYCDTLVLEINRLETLDQELSTNLEPFNCLEPIIRMLNSPGADFVTNPRFSDMLKQLDRALAYMDQHPDFKDSQVYKMRLRQCMTRSLSLIRVYFSKAIRSVAEEVQNSTQSTKSLSTGAKMSLMYVQFRVDAPTLLSLTDEISKRIPLHDEYSSLLDDCCKLYFGIRLKLIGPLVKQNIDGFKSERSENTLQFSRAAVSYLGTVSSEEYKLFHDFFSGADDQVYQFLEDLSTDLNDALRQRIIREPSIDNLCELCAYLENQSPEDDAEEEHDYDAEGGEHQGEQMVLNVGRLIRPSLEDCKARLVFRVQQYIEKQVARYSPTSDDLIIDPTTEHRNGRMSAFNGENNNNNNGFENSDDFDTGNLFAGWYPPLQRVITVLSKVYRLMEPAIFDDVAHQAIQTCFISLDNLFRFCEPRQGALVAHLLMMKHILILSNQIVAFDIEHVLPEVEFDFTPTVNMLSMLRRRFLGAGVGENQETGSSHDHSSEKSLLSLDGIYSLATSTALGMLPRVFHDMRNAKIELDSRLRRSVNEFCDHACHEILDSIFNPNCIKESLRAAIPKEDENVDKDNDSVGSEFIDKLRSSCQTNVSKIYNLALEYVADTRTVNILAQAIQDLLVTRYEDMYKEVVAIAGTGDSFGETTTTSSTTSRRSVEWLSKCLDQTSARLFLQQLWDVDGFAVWLDTHVFAPLIRQHLGGQDYLYYKDRQYSTSGNSAHAVPDVSVSPRTPSGVGNTERGLNIDYFDNATNNRLETESDINSSTAGAEPLTMHIDESRKNVTPGV